MSKMIPRETIDTLRDFVDVSLDNYGIDCTLYIPTDTSYENAEYSDVYATPSDYQYTQYSAKVFIEWRVSTYRLKRLGLYTEDENPIVAWFGNEAVDQEGNKVDVDITLHSYFEISPEFIPENYKGTAQFEIVNIAVQGMHDAVIRKAYSIVPRRVQV